MKFLKVIKIIHEMFSVTQCNMSYIHRIYIVAYLPHERTVESRKPRNMHATIELRMFIAHC
jgi:hypothetical protein